jgi:hypothetical protein
MNLENQNVRLGITFVIGLIVGFGGHWLWANRVTSTPNDEIMLMDDTASTTQALTSTNASVTVEKQEAGNKVFIKNVTLAAPGWVAIHDMVNGQPGKILGAKLFDKGSNEGFVDLLRITIPGKSYFAVLHGDDGDYKNFVPSADLPLMTNGIAIMSEFTTTELTKE